MIMHSDPQGSPEWLAARRGVITASRFRDALETVSGLTEQQQAYVSAMKAGQAQAEAMATAGYKSKPTSAAVALALADKLEPTFGAAAIAYAQDVARERVGGMAAPVYQNAAMRLGSEEEPFARMCREAEAEYLIDEAGFITTDDRLFGVSVDGLIGSDGVWECKTMVSSATLFKAIVDKDISEYEHQCNGALWLLGRRWVDLSLWCPDLRRMHTVRINRDEDRTEALEAGLMSFAGMVLDLETRLRAALGMAAEVWRPSVRPNVRGNLEPTR